MNAIQSTLLAPPLTYAPALQARSANLTAGPSTTSAAVESAGAIQGTSFSDRLRSAVDSVNTAQHNADDHLRAVASGQDVDLHATMIALEEADITLRAMTSMRDKVVDAYERVMNLSI